jgi:hypothetical protein
MEPHAASHTIAGVNPSARTSGSVLLLIAAHSLIGSSGALATAPSKTSSLTASNFVLQPPGLVVELHPRRTITVAATAAMGLRVCSWHGSFGSAWKGGCRRLSGRPIRLPDTGESQHVAFRIQAIRPVSVSVSQIQIRWHCADHAFYLGKGVTRLLLNGPTFDC